MAFMLSNSPVGGASAALVLFNDLHKRVKRKNKLGNKQPYIKEHFFQNINGCIIEIRTKIQLDNIEIDKNV